MEDFGQVEGAAGSALGDLFTATETIGDDEPVGWCLADGGEEFEFADGHRNVIFVCFKAEGAGHAAAAGSGALEIDAEAVEDGFFGGHLHQGFLMAVAVKNCFAVEWREQDMGSVGFEKLAEQESLA